MRRKIAHLDMRVEPRLIERIDAWRRGTPLSRTAAVEQMIQWFLERESVEREGITIDLPRRFIR